jgi:hypothetical protein
MAKKLAPAAAEHALSLSVCLFVCLFGITARRQPRNLDFDARVSIVTFSKVEFFVLCVVSESQKFEYLGQKLLIKYFIF